MTITTPGPPQAHTDAGTGRNALSRYTRTGGTPDLLALVSDLTGRPVSRRLKLGAALTGLLTLAMWSAFIGLLGTSGLGEVLTIVLGALVGLVTVLLGLFAVAMWSESRDTSLGAANWPAAGAAAAELAKETEQRVALLESLAPLSGSVAWNHVVSALAATEPVTVSESSLLPAFRDGEYDETQLRAHLEKVCTPLAHRLDRRLRHQLDDDWYEVTRGAHRPVLAALEHAAALGPGAPEALDALLEATTGSRTSVTVLLERVPELTSWAADGGDYDVLRGLGADWSGDLDGLIEAARLVDAAE